MATYNGEKWIEKQITSVLSQLTFLDELVVVDDNSSDQTFALIDKIDDPRIRVAKNDSNCGVIKTFQKALFLAHGDVLFLCDQDDIWLPGKVERTLRVFDEDDNVTLVVSDALIIDGDGRVIEDSFFGMRGRFVPGVVANIIKNKFLGCTMAVKSRMRDKFLPFPDPIPMHDMWIGIINEVYGKSHFISEPLVGYRRHGGNLSPTRRQGFIRMSVWRWQLIISLAKRVIKMSRSR